MKSTCIVCGVEAECKNLGKKCGVTVNYCEKHITDCVSSNANCYCV